MFRTTVIPPYQRTNGALCRLHKCKSLGTRMLLSHKYIYHGYSGTYKHLNPHKFYLLNELFGWGTRLDDTEKYYQKD